MRPDVLSADETSRYTELNANMYISLYISFIVDFIVSLYQHKMH